jgi:hypothetical protein
MKAMTIPMYDRPRIVVLGYIIRGPIGGLAWHHLQYFLGLHRLGHDVTFIEDSDDYPSCSHSTGGPLDTDANEGLRFATETFERVGLGDRWAYHDAHTAQWLGPCADRAVAICQSADLVFNLSGVNPLRPWLMCVPVRVLVDTDPVFTQVRHLTELAAIETAKDHTHFFTFGENIEGGFSTVPHDGLPWVATRQPVVLDAWPVTPVPPSGRFTSVMQWESYGARVYEGRRFGMKADSFPTYELLPGRVGDVLELAIGGAGAPRAELVRRGWRLTSSVEVSRTPWTYQSYLRQSRAEFSVAKHGYVAASSGWFSERSAAYLASGRPVVVQDTGFSRVIPSGRGVLPFRTPEEAIAGIETILADPQGQGRAAREIAASHFDSRPILGRLLRQSFAPAPLVNRPLLQSSTEAS